MKVRHSITFSNVVSVIALFLALGGGAYATVELKQIKADSVGTKQLKDNAVKSAKVADDALRGSDIDESTLGQVPTAATADNAAMLGSQSPATYRNPASSGYNDSSCNPSSATFVDCTSTTLDLPHAGKVLLVAGGGEVATSSDASGSCELRIDDSLISDPQANPGDSGISHYQSFYQNGFSITFVSAALAVGPHTFALACNESVGDQKIWGATISAMLTG